MCLFLYVCIVLSFMFSTMGSEKRTGGERGRRKPNANQRADRKSKRQTEDWGGGGQSHLKKTCSLSLLSLSPIGNWGERCQTVQCNDEETDGRLLKGWRSSREYKFDLIGITCKKFFNSVNRRKSSQLYLPVVSFTFCHSPCHPFFMSAWCVG